MVKVAAEFLLSEFTRGMTDNVIVKIRGGFKEPEMKTARVKKSL